MRFCCNVVGPSFIEHQALSEALLQRSLSLPNFWCPIRIFLSEVKKYLQTWLMKKYRYYCLGVCVCCFCLHFLFWCLKSCFNDVFINFVDSKININRNSLFTARISEWNAQISSYRKMYLIANDTLLIESSSKNGHG